MMVTPIPLGEVATFIRGITFKPEDKVEKDSPGAVVCMRTKNVQDLLDQDDLIAIPPSFVNRQEQYLVKGDILVSTANSWELVGKSCWVPKIDFKATAGGFISILRANREKVIPRYLYHWMNSAETLRNLRYCGRQTTNISNMSFELACDLKIPLPTLPEQKRIATILDKADSIRRKQQEAIQVTEELMRSVFLDMFGDPVTNPKGWKVSKLVDITSVQSGATPSTENDAYWNGNIPWVSPKDMKKVELYDSIDHVSDLAFKDTNLKKIEPLSILLVVRGMILVHTVPIAVNKCLIAINQDIKAFTPKSNILPEFLLWNLLVQHNHILSKVATAAHGTKRLEMSEVENIPVIVPSIELQKKFIDTSKKVTNIQTNITDSATSYDTLFNALLQYAFKGEL